MRRLTCLGLRPALSIAGYRPLGGHVITRQDPISRVIDTPVQPRARGAVRLSVKARDGGTALDELRQSGSLKVLFPRQSGQARQAVLINTAGGVTGGDRFCIQAHAAETTQLTLTTQASERAYRAQPGETGHLQTHLSIAANARINWLPQETLLFEASNLRRRLRIDMAESSRLLMVEPLVFGRKAKAERLTAIKFSDRVEIRRGGKPLFLDAMGFDGDAGEHLEHAFIGAGAGALATLIYVAPDAEGHLPILRQMLPDTAGASLIHGNLITLRILAADGFELRQSLIPILTRLLGAELPRPWMI